MITDDRMPYISGTDLLRQVQTRHPQLPVILASADDEAAQALPERCRPFASIRKPYDPSRLLAAVGSAARAIAAAASDSLGTLE